MSQRNKNSRRCSIIETKEIINLIMTMVSTAVGAVLGGIVTLIVNKKFEITRITINNVNDMKNDVTPALQRYVRALKSTRDFLLANEFYEKTAEQKDIVSELENSLAEVNEKVDTYEIELSSMLDFHELLLQNSFVLLNKLKEVDIAEDEQSYFGELKRDLDRLVDMVATFSEEVSEIKRNMLRGNVKPYWRKDIFAKEKTDRIDYHSQDGRKATIKK